MANHSPTLRAEAPVLTPAGPVAVAHRPEIIGDYEILGQLGQGGMGAVYRARQVSLDRVVALKILPSQLEEDETYVARFQREAAVAAGLRHPNLVHVYASGCRNGCHFIAMELVEGENLRQRLKRGGVPMAEAVRDCLEVARGLQFAWQRAQLIHRDIKPSNIYLAEGGAVKLGDLGLAKSLLSDTTELTHTGAAIGTPHYISPEQARGDKSIDLRADIYSLGCTLYELLTGVTPYRGTDPLSVMMMHVSAPPPAIMKVLPQCPIPLGRLVSKMLQKTRHERHQTYEELIAAMESVLAQLEQGGLALAGPSTVVAGWKESAAARQRGIVSAQPTSAPPPTPTTRTRRPPAGWMVQPKRARTGARQIALTVGVLLLPGALLIYALWPAPLTQAQIRRAQLEAGARAAAQAQAATAPTPDGAPPASAIPTPFPEFLPPGPAGLVKTFPVPLAACNPILVSADHRALFVEDGKWMQLFDLATGEAVWRAYESYADCIVVLAHEKTALCVGRAGERGGAGGRAGAHLINLATGEEMATWEVDGPATSKLAAEGSPDSRRCAIAYDGPASGLHVVVVETEALKPVAVWNLPSLPYVCNVAWLDNDRLIVSLSGFSDWLLLLDTRQAGEPPPVYPASFGLFIRTDPARQLIAGSRADGCVVAPFFSPQQETALPTPHPQRQFQFLSDDLAAGLNLEGNSLRLWDLKANATLTEVHPAGFADTMAVSRDGSFALVGLAADPEKGLRQLTLWRLRSLAPSKP